MHIKMSAKEVLAYLIYILERNLAELTCSEKSDYVQGSWDASIECLEIIGLWTQAKAYGLNYNPEIKFQII